MSEPHLPIFVYGTLKRGEVRERCWPHVPISIEPATTRGRLYDLGPYPALTEGDNTVAGELWLVASEHLAETLRVLDEIECFGNAEVDLYVRRVVPCRTVAGQVQDAFTYLFADPAKLTAARAVDPNEHGVCSWRGSGMDTRHG